MTPSPAPSVALHRLATLLAGTTFILIFIGGLVTSTGSGLAVPDWPLSFGQFFPPMVGGVFYEHGHRMVATLVGMLTVALAVAARLTGATLLIQRLTLLAVATVITQGVLGGVTVLFLLPTPVSVGHACLAQAFLCLTVALAVITAPSWQGMRAPGAEGDPGLRALTAATVATVYVQLILGAIMRHTGAGLAIPDFPLAFGGLVPPFDLPGVPVHFLHRMGALAVTVMVMASLASVRARSGEDRRLTRPARLAAVLVLFQVTLGALTIWTGKAVLPTTTHVVCGAAVLAATFVLALRTWRITAATPQDAPTFVEVLA